MFTLIAPAYYLTYLYLVIISRVDRLVTKHIVAQGLVVQ